MKEVYSRHFFGLVTYLHKPIIAAINSGGLEMAHLKEPISMKLGKGEVTEPVQELLQVSQDFEFIFGKYIKGQDHIGLAEWVKS